MKAQTFQQIKEIAMLIFPRKGLAPTFKRRSISVLNQQNIIFKSSTFSGSHLITQIRLHTQLSECVERGLSL